MHITQELKKLGLKQSEITIYLYLLEHGLTTPAAIAKGTTTLRANAYATLASLREKGLIDRQMKGKRYLYFPTDPLALISSLEKKTQAAQAIVPDLRALFKAHEGKPTVKFYYGADQVKELFSQAEDTEEILFIATSDILFESYPAFFTRFRKQVAKKGIFVRDILTTQSGKAIAEKTKNTMRGYYDYRFLPKRYADMPTSIRIWGDTVALVTFDPMFGTALTSKPLAQTFRVIFETMWSTASR